MINRREFIFGLTGSILLTMTGDKSMAATPKNKRARVSLVSTSDRESGIKKAIELLGINSVRGKMYSLNQTSIPPMPSPVQHIMTLLQI